MSTTEQCNSVAQNHSYNHMIKYVMSVYIKSSLYTPSPLTTRYICEEPCGLAAVDIGIPENYRQLSEGYWYQYPLVV